MLFWGFGGSEALASQLTVLVPTFKMVESLRQVRQDEWDVLVTNQTIGIPYESEPAASLHLCVVYLGSQGPDTQIVESRGQWSHSIVLDRGLIAQELQRIRLDSDRAAALIHEKLEPVLLQRTSHEYFKHGGNFNPNGPEEPSTVQAFIAAGDGSILAGWYDRSDSSQAWLLPSDTPDLHLWVKAALAEWHDLAPNRFPGIPDWSHLPRWMTAEEISLVSDLDGLNSRREAMLRQLADEEAGIRVRLRVARDEADGFERALLTTQSEDLVAVVIKALSELGFKVVDADTHADPSDHLEDIRIEDSDEPGWIALGEVKGYTKGAKTEALTQFLRFQARYVQRIGSTPSAMWYIVNQFLARDPSTRQPVLHGKDDDVRAFASGRGLVLDTTELFRLLMDVRDGSISASEARVLLRTATGRFSR